MTASLNPLRCDSMNCECVVFTSGSRCSIPAEDPCRFPRAPVTTLRLHASLSGTDAPCRAQLRADCSDASRSALLLHNKWNPRRVTRWSCGYGGGTLFVCCCRAAWIVGLRVALLVATGNLNGAHAAT